MEYEKTNWVDHVVENPNTYTLTQNEDGTYLIEPAPGSVLQQGTNINAEHLNNMENGIAEAHEELENKMPKEGGEFSGNVTVNGNLTANGMNANGEKVENVADPTEPADAANKGYVDSKHLGPISAILGTTWQGESPPYTQIISVAGVLASDRPKIGPVLSDNFEAAMAQKEAWNCVSDAKSANGTITFRCFELMPEVNIPIMIEVDR